MANLKFKEIYKYYNDSSNPTVINFNLDIEDKEFIVLVGPSGCGKSTTLRMLAGLEEISKGDIYINDKLVNNIPPKDRDIAMVFQNYALYPHMTVYDNMAFGLKLRKIPKDKYDTRVKETAKSLGLEDFLNRKPSALSGGQRQRVALGRAIVREPQVFLMDEPLSNLDAKLRVQTRTEIIKLHKKLQTTFIYVTHDQTEAMTMGDRIIVMNKGIIQQVDTPQNIYAHPINTFVASFIGSPQMNFINTYVQKVNSIECSLTFDNNNIKLSEKQSKALIEQNYIGKEIILGIRPEDIYDEQSKLELYKDTIINACIDIKELLGSEIYLYLSTQNNILITKTTSENKDFTKEKIKVTFNPNKIHLFDKETKMIIA